MSKYKVWVFLILCNLFWAGNYVFGKYVVAEMTPLIITFSRWLMASVFLFGIAYYFEKPNWKTVLKAWPILTVMAILGIIIYNLVLYSALNYTSSTNAALVNSLNPAVIVLFSGILLREKVSLIQALGIFISLTGVIVILTGGKLGEIFQFQFNRGDLLMLVAITAWTLYSIIGKRIKNIPPITATAVSALIAAVIMAPFALLQGIHVSQISSLAVIGILYITIFPSVGSFVFWNIGMREIGASKAGIFLNLIPVFTALISWAMGNGITGVQISGGILVFIGVYMTTGMVERLFRRPELIEE